MSDPGEARAALLQARAMMQVWLEYVPEPTGAIGLRGGSASLVLVDEVPTAFRSGLAEGREGGGPGIGG